MVTTATGQNRYHVLSRVGKEWKSGHGCVTIPPENMEETAANTGRLSKFDLVRKKHVQVSSLKYIDNIYINTFLLRRKFVSHLYIQSTTIFSNALF